MCGLTILPADLAKHPKCLRCLILLEPEFNQKTVCWCGKYHNAPSLKNPKYCRLCMNEEVPTGTPKGQPRRLQDDEPDELSELLTLN
jgi:hypothetical protein